MTAETVDAHAGSAADTVATSAAAAAAAAPLIPSPHPLVAAPAPGGRPDGDALAYVAEFTGGVSGQVLLVLHPDVAAALTAGVAGVELADAVRPALEAAATSTGPCVLGPVTSARLDDVAPDGSSTALVTLLGAGDPLAWLGLSLRASGTTPARTPATAGSTVDALSGLGLHLLRDVELVLSVEIGRARMTVRDLMQLAPGSVVELDRAAGAPADLLVNGRLIARGEVVVVDEDFGLRITELVQPAGETTP